MQDDYPTTDPSSVNNDSKRPLPKLQFPPCLSEEQRNLCDILQNADNQNLTQDISQHLSAGGSNTGSLDFLLPAIRYKLYGLLVLWNASD